MAAGIHCEREDWSKGEPIQNGGPLVTFGPALALYRVMGLVATYPIRSSTAPAEAPAGPDRLVVELFQAHADGVFRLAMLMLDRRPDAEDVVQDTFLRLLRHVSANRPLPNARGWIYTVAAHACRDRQRAARRWLPWLAELDLRASPDQPDSADRSAPIRSALRRLSARDRLLITLRAQGLGYSEIGSATGLRTTSVGRILSRALERFARQLDALGARP